jgi:hypothetical protein
MNRKIAIAFVGLLLMLTASFAPIVQAPVPGTDRYVTMAGKVDGTLFMYVNTVAPWTRFGLSLPLLAPFVRTNLDPSIRALVSPMYLLQDITFSAPIDVGGYPGPDIISISAMQVNPLVHYVFVPFRGTFWRFMLVQPQAGHGVIFINPGMPGDVDCYTYNLDAGVFWNAPSQLAGQPAAASGGQYKPLLGDFDPPLLARFPSPGVDGVPGTRLWGDPLDGFGDGVPDPVGSSILMLPFVMMGDEWNGAAWVPTLAVPMPMVLTTGVAYDVVAQPESNLYGLASLEVGDAWDTISTGHPWDHPKAFIKVTYVCAWSNLLYCINPDDDGDCMPNPEDVTLRYYTVDMFYEFAETKVRTDVVVPDINNDNTVNIQDIVIAALAFGKEDEGLGRDGIPGTADDKLLPDLGFDPRADLTHDGYVNIIDLVKIAVAFGATLDP